MGIAPTFNRGQVFCFLGGVDADSVFDASNRSVCGYPPRNPSALQHLELRHISDEPVVETLQAVMDRDGDARQIGQRLVTTIRTSDQFPTVRSQLVCTSLNVSNLWCFNVKQRAIDQFMFNNFE